MSSGQEPAAVEQEVGTSLVIAGIGELVDPRDEAACIRALDSVRDLERQLREAKGALTEAIAARAAELGTKTLHRGAFSAEVRGGSEVVYDAEAIEVGLRAVGAPEELIREIVQETVSYRVDGRRAKRAAGANPDYAQVIEGHRRTVDKPVSISIRRG